MATRTFLDAIGILENIGFIQVIGPMILTWVIVYALFVKSKFLKEDLAALAAFVISLMVVIVPEARLFITTITPMFSLFMIIILLILMLFLMMGAKEGDVSKLMKNSSFYLFVIIIAIIFVFVSLSTVFSNISPIVQGSFPNDTSNLSQSDILGIEVLKILTNPGYLGVVILLVLISITVWMITRS